jgi:hypothetical protein
MLEATDLLLRKRTVDTSSTVVIWQVGGVCDTMFKWKGYYAHNLPQLVEALISIYGPMHEGILYEAAHYASCNPVIKRLSLMDIRPSMVNASSTLVVPPKVAEK